MPSSHATPLRNTSPIAIVGIGALFPGSSDKTGFWRDLLAGRDLITEVPPSHWLIDDYFDPDPNATDKVYVKRGAFLQETEFSPRDFGIRLTETPSTDTAQLLALLAAKQVLEDATGSQLASMDRSRISVVLGASSVTELMLELNARMQRPVWADALRQHGFDPEQVEAICNRISSQYVPWTKTSFPGLLGNVVAGRIANRFDLAGTNCSVDAACASSLAALHVSLMELESGHSDLVITGGVDALNNPTTYACFSKTPAMSRTGDCRPFSANADGTMLGEGLGMLALKRIADAERDGDRIYAVIRGLGTSSDGMSRSIYTPVPEGQAKAMRRAYAAAGYEPHTVELVEAHGSGTPVGDRAEFQSLSGVFDEPPNTHKRWCALGSIKSQIGHTKAASGSAGLIKTVMALHHKVLPPTIKVDQPNPALHIEESPFYLNTRARPWLRGSSHPRRASVNSFGLGGTNYHVTLEEYTGSSPRRPRLRTHEFELLLVAADSATELIEQCRGLDLRPASLAHTAHQSLQSWRGGNYRIALVVKPGEADAVMAQALDHIERQPEQPIALLDVNVEYAVGAPVGSLGMIFSGEGGQYLEMGRDLAMSFDAARDVWDKSADLNLDSIALHETVFPPPAFSEEERKQQESLLAEPRWAQPAICAVQLAQVAMLRQLGIEPAAGAGHGFGELTALAAAGSLSADDLLRIGWFSGSIEAVEATALDSPIAASSVAALHDCLADIDVCQPRFPVYATGTAQAYPAAPAQIRLQLACAMPTPVRFPEQINAMHAAGVRIFLEVGPGNHLSTTVEQTLAGRPHLMVSLDRAGGDGVLMLCQAIAKLAAAGIAMRPAALWQEYAEPMDPGLQKKPAVSISISGTNYGRPYPPAPGSRTQATASDTAQPPIRPQESWLDTLAGR